MRLWVGRLWFPVLLGFCIWISYLITTSTIQPTRDSSIKVEVAPSTATVKLDGKRISKGVVKVASGSYELSVEKKGFASQTQHVEARKGKESYIGISLQSNSSDTSSWYDKHQDDSKLSEGISSHRSDAGSNAAVQANPFLLKLPLTIGDSINGIVRIDKGRPIEGSSEPAVYISANSPAQRKEVLNYIRNQGYVPAEMDIVFTRGSFPRGDGEGD